MKVRKSHAKGKENNNKRASIEDRQKEVSINAQHDEMVIKEILNASPKPTGASSEPKSVQTPAHPHFGGKQPKQHRAPPKCISVLCKEEKEVLREELLQLKKELADALKELSKYQFFFL